MNPTTISAIRDFTLKARELMLTEVEEQLEGIYGLLPDGHFEPAEKYPALNSLEEAKETRRRLERYFTDQEATGVSSEKAREKLVKEISFTRLNRMVALKMIETRGLIRRTVTKGVDSNGFKRWVVQEGNEAEYEKYEAGEMPQNAIGEGPRQEAYRHYILWHCAILSEEIRVLFDSKNLASLIFPRPNALKQLIEMMNELELEKAWKPGNEETIGWIYQYHNEPDLEIFRGNSSLKVPPHLVAPRTQQFTPNWVVKFLTHNTLGRLWLEMHPDSSIKKELTYLVPFENELEKRKVKPVKEISVLDPACGTMHFGLAAFDLLTYMYREEIVNAGQPGWPDKASLENEEEIPVSILKNNLYGIDIDHRALQLSALTLYLKAKSFNPKASLEESNLVSANVMWADNIRIKQFLGEVGLTRPIYFRILNILGDRLRDSEHLGSLLRLEQEIQTIVEQEKKEFNKTGLQLELFDQPKKAYEKGAVQLEFWDALEAQIELTIHHFAKSLEDKIHSQSFYVGETTKGLKLLDILSNRYDVVITNPPYLDNRDYNQSLKKLLSKNYPDSKRNLFSVCTERFLEFLNKNGRLGIITGQSFMFISTFEKFRKNLLKDHIIESLAQYDYGLFDARVDTVAFVLRRQPDSNIRRNNLGFYFRLVKQPDNESKRRRFEECLAQLRKGEFDPAVFRYRQSNFNAIPGSPWVYWITHGIRKLFETLPKLEDIALPRVGLQTGQNFRFLRYWWEVGKKRIGFNLRDAEAAKTSGKKWFPYMKGGEFKRWYGNQEYVVNWQQNGAEIRTIGIESGKIASRPQNREYYFRRGITYSYLTAGTFSARISPGGFIFDVAGSSLFPEDIPLVLAIMNSTFSAYGLKLINPTVNFQVGDLARLPVPIQSSSIINSLVDGAVKINKAICSENETTYDFVNPTDWGTGIEDLRERIERLKDIEQQLDEEIYHLYNMSDKNRNAIESDFVESIRADLDKDKINKEMDFEDSSIEKTTVFARDELAKRWINYAAGIAVGRFEPGIEGGLGRSNFSAEIAKRLKGMADPDGIMVMDEGHPDDLVTNVWEALLIMLNISAADDVIKTAVGKDGSAEELLRTYLERSFFKEHIKQYRKRPVYWLLESPKKKYGVWLFHEKMNQDTLFRIRTEYVEPKINHLESQIAGLQSERDKAEGRVRRQIEKRIGNFTEILDDVREFQKLLKFVSEERGYSPHIDDGVLLNMAPLWELIPSWQAEPRKAWKALERGDYDWSYQAMDHWPERVKEKCKTNKSYAIAHGLDDK
jgi:hypothetical protein